MKIILIILIPLFLRAQTINPLFEYEKAKYNRSGSLTKIHYPGDINIDINYYKLNLTINYSAQNIKGEVTAAAKCLYPLKDIFLDLNNSLIVDSVSISGIPLSYIHSDNRLIIILDREYPSGSYINITVYYQGKPGTSGFGSFVFSSHNGHPAIWSLSEPYGASDWWPCKDTPADKADSADIIITVPTPLYAVSNGILVKIINNDNGTDTYIWKSTYPIANYLISLAISNYTEFKQYFRYSESDSMPVNHYIYPERFEELKPELERTLEMLEIFTPMFGPYPFIREKYGHAQFASGGMEHQTVTSIGTFTEDVIAHELAHQWFGDMVTCRNWQNIWLNEGFATYGSVLYFQAKYGKEAYDNLISTHMGYSKIAKGSIYVQDITKVNEIFNGQRSYSKGAIVLHMLRGITGDSVFFRILKEYLNDPGLSYGTAVTEDFQAAAEKVYGSSLNYFFNEWIYGENYPKYNVDWLVQKNDQGYLLKVNINQKANTSPQYFTMPVQIKISFSGSDTLITLFNKKMDEQFILQFEKEPSDLIFDPNNYILKEVSYGINSQVPVSFKLDQNYPNPFNAGTTISFRIGRRTLVKLSIHNILGKEVAVPLNEELLPDIYSIKYNPADLPSGIYFYTLHAGESIETKKMIILR